MKTHVKGKPVDPGRTETRGAWRDAKRAEQENVLTDQEGDLSLGKKGGEKSTKNRNRPEAASSRRDAKFPSR